MIVLRHSKTSRDKLEVLSLTDKLLQVFPKVVNKRRTPKKLRKVNDLALDGILFLTKQLKAIQRLKNLVIYLIIGYIGRSVSVHSMYYSREKRHDEFSHMYRLKLPV